MEKMNFKKIGYANAHILLSPYLQETLKQGGVDTHVCGWDKSSDHAPVWIEIDKSKI